MVRVKNWDKLLSQYIQEMRKQPFVWGVNDCVLFAARGLFKLTDVDFFSQYLPYENEEQARDIIEEAGGLEDLVSRHLGNPHHNYKNAYRGDLAIVEIPEQTLGLVDDSGQFVACVGKNGLNRIPLKHAKTIWSY